MAMVKNPHVYTKMEKEDPEEMIHRRAQFLIQKILERSDTEPRQRKQQQRIRSSGTGAITAFARKRVVGIRVRIGRRLRRLRKSVIVHVRLMAKDCVSNNLMGHFKSWRRLFRGSRRNVSSSSSSSLPPLFALQV